MIRRVIELCQDISMHQVFNPYFHRCQIHDHQLSDQIRTKNLKLYLERMESIQPKTAWIGEALGYLGGRRTGLPFTDDYHLGQINKTYNIVVKKATTSSSRKEITAGITWEMIAELDIKPFLWNVFPFHPYDDFELSNRRPKRSEIDQTHKVLQTLLDNFHPKKIYAIGKAAKKGLKRLGYDAEYIRHPSHGGANIFRKQIRKNYE